MDIKGKKVVCLGDSITEGSGASSVEKCWVSLLAEKTGATTRNFGIGGTRLARQYSPTLDNPRHDLDFCGRVKDLDADADLVIVFGGTNDFGHGDAPFGTDADTTNDTFCGAINQLYTMLKEKYDVPVVVLTPLRRSEELREGYPEVLFPGKEKLETYVEAIRRGAARYGLPMLELYNSELRPEGPWGPYEFFYDGLHPNDNGYEKLTEKIMAFIESL